MRMILEYFLTLNDHTVNAFRKDTMFLVMKYKKFMTY